MRLDDRSEVYPAIRLSRNHRFSLRKSVPRYHCTTRWTTAGLHCECRRFYTLQPIWEMVISSFVYSFSRGWWHFYHRLRFGQGSPDFHSSLFITVDPLFCARCLAVRRTLRASGDFVCDCGRRVSGGLVCSADFRRSFKRSGIKQRFYERRGIERRWCGTDSVIRNSAERFSAELFATSRFTTGTSECGCPGSVDPIEWRSIELVPAKWANAATIASVAAVELSKP